MSSPYATSGHDGEKRLEQRTTKVVTTYVPIADSEAVNFQWDGQEWGTAYYNFFENGDTACQILLTLKDGDPPYEGMGYAFLNEGDKYNRNTARVLSFYRAMRDVAEDIEAVRIAEVEPLVSEVPSAIIKTSKWCGDTCGCKAQIVEKPEESKSYFFGQPVEKFATASELDRYLAWRWARHAKWHVTNRNREEENQHLATLTNLYISDFDKGERAPGDKVKTFVGWEPDIKSERQKYIDWREAQAIRGGALPDKSGKWVEHYGREFDFGHRIER